MPELVIWRPEAWTIQALDRVDRWIVRGEGAVPGVLRIDGSADDLIQTAVREQP